MKRNVIKKLGLNKKKWGLSLMLAGLAALNMGFTDQTEKIENTEVAQVEEVDILPTTPVTVEESSTINIDEFETVSENINVEPVEEVTAYQPQDYGYAAVMTMEATAYLPTDGDGYCITATGIPATYGVAAVDPAVIPLGSRLYIPGYGEAIAADTGGAIYGNRIDLCMESYYEAIQFGRRDVTVYVLR